jgi:hypothetical protein
VRCGESLHALLDAHQTEALLGIEWTLRQPWNCGFGAESERAADEVRSLLERVEELQQASSCLIEQQTLQKRWRAQDIGDLELPTGPLP